MDSAAVTATGTTFWAASTKDWLSRTDNRQHALISAPGPVLVIRLRLIRVDPVLLEVDFPDRFRSSRDGRSTKYTASNLSARANSGGNLVTSLAVQQTKNVSDSRSLSHDRNEPNIRAETPLSDCPDPATPANALSSSSRYATQGCMASMICNACRVRCSV